MFGHFLLIPHFANYFQFNLGFPRQQIAALYLCGGLANMATMRLCGGWIDQGRAQGAILLTSLLLALVTLLGFALPVGLPVYLLFTLFMALSSARASTTLAVTAAIPAPISAPPSCPSRARSPMWRPGSAACSPPDIWSPTRRRIARFRRPGLDQHRLRPPGLHRRLVPHPGTEEHKR